MGEKHLNRDFFCQLVFWKRWF